MHDIDSTLKLHSQITEAKNNTEPQKRVREKKDQDVGKYEYYEVLRLR